MPARSNPAAELAEQMVQTLRAQRDRGGDAYPLTLKQVIELTDPSAAADLRLRAAKARPFSSAVVRAGKNDPDAPLALAEDAERLAGSRLLLEWLLNRVRTPKAPAQPVDKVVKKADAALRGPLKEALDRQLRDGSLPETVAAVDLKGKPHLYLKRMPPPKDPVVELAEKLLQTLRQRRAQGGDAYPATLPQLVQAAQPDAPATLVHKATSEKRFKAEAVMARSPSSHLLGFVLEAAEAPVVLKGDEDLLASSPALLRYMVASLRTDSNQALPAADLKKKLARPLQPAFADAVQQRLASHTLPPGIGVLRIKKKEHLFLLQDISAVGPAPAVTREEVEPPAPVPFADAFETAYVRLDREKGGHDFVSLVDLRRALPYDRATFDSELRNLRRAGLFTLSTAEARHGLSPEEQEAGIREEGTLLLSVSRKRI